MRLRFPSAAASLWPSSREVGDAGEIPVDRDAVEITGGVLIDRLDLGIGERRDRRRIGRVDVQDAARARDRAVNGAVDAPGRRVGRVRAVHRVFVVGVEAEEIARLEAGEMPPARIHQKSPAVVAEREAEMIGDRFVPVVADGEAESGGEIDARLPLIVVGFREREGRRGEHGRSSDHFPSMLYRRAASTKRRAALARGNRAKRGWVRRLARTALSRLVGYRIYRIPFDGGGHVGPTPSSRCAAPPLRCGAARDRAVPTRQVSAMAFGDGTGPGGAGLLAKGHGGKKAWPARRGQASPLLGRPAKRAWA